MPKYGFFVVEGPHDVWFVYRLLSAFAFKLVKQKDDLDSFWQNLVPSSFPPDGDLQKRVPVPTFLQSDTHSIAISSAIGDSRLIQTVEENAAQIEIDKICGIGILLDSDQQLSAAERYDAIKIGLLSKGFTLPDNPGEITEKPLRMGAFVLPDNQNPGTLEDLLLECASQIYPNLLQNATTYINSVSTDDELIADDLKDFEKPSGRNKAIVGSIASVLRPGKAVQVSIQDNRWLRDDALKIARVKAVQDFLAKLLEL